MTEDDERIGEFRGATKTRLSGLEKRVDRLEWAGLGLIIWAASKVANFVVSAGVTTP